MNTRASNRISPEYALLGFLFHTPSYGYKLHQQLLNQFGSIWHARQSQTYNILNRLESQGHIRSTLVEQEKHPARQLLQITDEGVNYFEDWLAQPSRASVHAIRVEFITRLYFTQLYFPERTGQLIQTQREKVLADITHLQSELARFSEQQAFNRLALELRLELLVSVMQWLERCRQFTGTIHADGSDHA